VEALDENGLNNTVELCGILGAAPAVSHTSRDEAYYIFPLEVGRLSGAVDQVNVIAKASLLETVEVSEKEKVWVKGELRSFNNKSGQGNRLVLTVFAREIELTDKEDTNEVLLRGALCKQPNLRHTPMGREICDLMLAVSRRYGRSDYLPCIAWGQNARGAADLQVGSQILLKGRLQSRKYIKVSGGTSQEKIAFEVSAGTIAPLDGPDAPVVLETSEYV